MFDELVCHACILNHLAIDGDDLVTNVEGIMEEWAALLVPSGYPGNTIIQHMNTAALFALLPKLGQF